MRVGLGYPRVMTDLAASPLRIVALILACLTIIPTAVVILRVMGRLTDPGASRRARSLDAVWTVVPVVGLIVLLALAAVA